MSTKTHEERRQDMLIAISRGRSSLATAMLEDEAIRAESENRARQYVVECEIEKNEMPQWMWLLLFFLLGMLFCMSVYPLQNFITDMIKITRGGA